MTTLLPLVWPLEGKVSEIFSFVAEPSIVMLIALTFATFTLGTGMGMSMKKVMDIYVEAVKDVSIILLIVSGAGALKQVFTDSGVSGQIAAMLQGWTINPLVLGWLIAAIIRVAMGSATVAGFTTAGIIAPVIAQTGVDPNLMVLSIGAGSLMFSHVNDSGFWMFKEYFNLSIKDTIRSWSSWKPLWPLLGSVVF